jgi:hypothetical protein
MAATAVESATAMESAKGMATAEMSSAETMAEEMVSPIVAAVVAVVTKPSATNVRPVKRSNNPIPSASAKQKDSGSSY